MPFALSDRSLSRLQGVHPLLVRVVKRAIEITDVDFGVVEGLRSLERQKQMVAEGKSQTLKSKHLTGHAVDVMAYVAGKGTYEPWSLYERINDAMQKAALELGISITWGGSWRTLKDGVHFELDPVRYPMPVGTPASPPVSPPLPTPKPPVAPPQKAGEGFWARILAFFRNLFGGSA